MYIMCINKDHQKMERMNTFSPSSDFSLAQGSVEFASSLVRKRPRARFWADELALTELAFR